MVRNLIRFNKAWLGAIALFLMVGVVTLTFAFKPAKSVVTPKRFSVQQWYSLAGSSINPNASNQTITGTLSTPPPATDEEDCAISGNSGNFCAVLIQFEEDIAPTITSGTVQDALTASPGSFIVTGVGTSGYSRLPL